ncbi:Axin-2 [Cichlidogyrus casuarinus]|uniref:Axin-2 n=1 Tax=Cichlidogyrus casuarinus TaxID=1844966 RepID=A0ABD2PY44_9PLAT
MAYPSDLSRSCHEADGKSVRSWGSGGNTSGSGGVYGSLYGAIIDASPQKLPISRWSLSLDNLLEDQIGVDLFRSYLKQIGSNNMLDFWFACNGLKQSIYRGSEPEKVQRLVKIIYRYFIKSSSSSSISIKTDTKRQIYEKISKTQSFDKDIFATAHSEIDKYLREIAYPAFLTSELYIRFIQNSLNHSHLYQQQFDKNLPTLTEEDDSRKQFCDDSAIRYRPLALHNQSKLQPAFTFSPQPVAVTNISNPYPQNSL